jgi:hypothetical protein
VAVLAVARHSAEPNPPCRRRAPRETRLPCRPRSQSGSPAPCQQPCAPPPSPETGLAVQTTAHPAGGRGRSEPLAPWEAGATPNRLQKNVARPRVSHLSLSLHPVHSPSVLSDAHQDGDDIQSQGPQATACHGRSRPLAIHVIAANSHVTHQPHVGPSCRKVTWTTTQSNRGSSHKIKINPSPI